MGTSVLHVLNYINISYKISSQDMFSMVILMLYNSKNISSYKKF